MTPEFQLLLACARTHAGPAHTASIRSALAGPFDYARFLSLVTTHSVTPLVYRNLQAVCWDLLPPAFQAELAGCAHATAGRSRFLTAELLSILHSFEAAGIRAVPFKGPALAASAYGDIGFREFTDLDIYARQRDLPAMARVLQERGYRPEAPERGAHAQSSAFLRNECQYHFWGLNGSTLVELHWRLAQRYFDFPFPLETCWERLAETRLEGRPILAFAPEDQLLFLCVHAAKHFWSSLNWVCDLAELIRAFPDLDWQRAFHQAAQVRNERTLLQGLALAHRLLGAGLPPWVQTQIAPVSNSVLDDVIRRLETLADPSILQMVRLHMARKSGFVQKLRQCAMILVYPSSGDWAAGPAPLPILALRRPLRLFWKYR